MDNIIELFKQNGSYNKNMQFFAVVIFLGIMLLVPKQRNYVYAVILIVFAVFVVNVFAKESLQNIKDINKETMLKLIDLQNIIVNYQKTSVKKKFNNYYSYTRPLKTLDFMYLDATLIHFLHSVKALNQYNPKEFYKLLLGINNILRLKGQIEEFYSSNNVYPENIAQMLEDAILLKSKTVNNMHNFIYSVPKSNIMYKYVNNIISRYLILISRNVDKIHAYYKSHMKQTGYNSQTKVVVYNTTMPVNENDDLNAGLKDFYK